MDESFKITNRLDRDRFEVWYMSYNANPKAEYRYDKFLHRVPYEKTPSVYAECDILLKSSWLENFSYPPIEMRPQEVSVLLFRTTEITSI